MTHQAKSQDTSPPCVYELKTWAQDQLHQELSSLVKRLIKHDIDLQFAKKALETHYIEEVLQSHEGNIGHTAKTLGIHRNTLSKRIRELKIAL